MACIETPVRALIFVSDSLGELCIVALSTPRSVLIRRIGMSLEGQRGVQFCEVTLGCFIISNSNVLASWNAWRAHYCRYFSCIYAVISLHMQHRWCLTKITLIDIELRGEPSSASGTSQNFYAEISADFVNQSCRKIYAGWLSLNDTLPRRATSSFCFKIICISIAISRESRACSIRELRRRPPLITSQWCFNTTLIKIFLKSGN
jgi:hypothetical protein